MPSVRTIWRYWDAKASDLPSLHGGSLYADAVFGDEFLFDEGPPYREEGEPWAGICFGCGFAWPLERAHLLARVYGGTDDPDNLALLCEACHRVQPDDSREAALDYIRRDGSRGWFRDRFGPEGALVSWMSAVRALHPRQWAYALLHDREHIEATEAEAGDDDYIPCSHPHEEAA